MDPPLRIVSRDIKDRRRGRKNQFAPATSPGVINSADSTILFAGCRRAREGNDIGALRRAAGVLFARVLNWLTRPPPLPGYEASSNRARAILNLEDGSSLISPESRIHDPSRATRAERPSLPAESISVSSPVNDRGCARVGVGRARGK